LPGREVYVEGWFQNTLGPLAARMALRGERLALLRIDADLYESVKAVMAHMVPLLSPGGLLVLDDYQDGGGKLATDEWLAANGYDGLPFRPVPGNVEPTVYAVWPGPRV
jgi:hypothetical protein